MGWGEETFFLQVFLWEGRTWMTSFMVNIAMNVEGGGGGDFDLGDFFESRVSRRDIGKI